jgi:hypothetical protein
MPVCPASVARQCGPPVWPAGLRRAPLAVRPVPERTPVAASHRTKRATRCSAQARPRLREHGSAQTLATKIQIFFPRFDGLQASIAILLTEDAGIGVPAA